MPNSSNILRAACLCAGVVLLTGCSEYLQRRDAISLSAGDAVMTDRVTLMVDPWPRESANKHIAFNGERMESAVRRYRTNKVIEPRSMSTGDTYQAQAPSPDPSNNTPVGPGVAAAPVK